MRQFLRTFIIFIAPVIIIGFSTEVLLRKIPNDYSYKKNYLDQHANTLKILFLGNSHAYYGMDPEYTHYPSFNAAYVSQSYNCDAEILKKYENKLDSLKYIVLPLDYASLNGRLEKGSESWRVKNYAIYYDIGITHNIADKTEIFNNNLKVISKRISGYYFQNISAGTCSKLGWGNDDTYKNRKDLATSGKVSAQIHKSRTFSDDNIKSLQSIVEFAKARNIKLVLYTSPAYKTYQQNFTSEQLEQSTNLGTSLAGTNPGTVVYFNLLNDSSFVADDYYDADHMDEWGAKKLTRKIDSLIMALPIDNAVAKYRTPVAVK